MAAGGARSARIAPRRDTSIRRSWAPPHEPGWRILARPHAAAEAKTTPAPRVACGGRGRYDRRPEARPMAYDQILYDVRDRIATITFNRPERLNAWTPHMGRELYAAFQEAAA